MITPTVTADVAINAVSTPNQNHINPATELAIMAAILWKPVNDPMAVAVSFLSVMLLIHALEIPSVAAAYNP